jgi:hypothetical protein
MKYVLNIAAVLLFSYPAKIVGYVWQAIVSGFESGMFIHKMHEDAAIKKFTKKSERKV